MDNYGYIYKTTDLRNGKVYVGQKKGKFDPRYFGSGVYITRAVQKNGTENFQVVVLKNALTKEEADVLEKKFIFEHRQSLGTDKVYNLTDGGDGLSNPPQEVRNKISKSLRGCKRLPESVEQQKQTRTQNSLNGISYLRSPREVRQCEQCTNDFICKVKSKKKYCTHACYLNAFKESNTVQREVRHCDCGCGGSFECRPSEKKRYIPGHHCLGKKHSQDFITKRVLGRLKIV